MPTACFDLSRLCKLKVTSKLGATNLAAPGSTTIVAPDHILDYKVQQTLLRQAQHQLLRQAQQALPNWPNIYKLAKAAYRSKD